MTWIATTNAARCEFLAHGDTEADAKKNVVGAYRQFLKNVGEPSPSLGSRFTVEQYEDYYGIWTYDLSRAAAFCDGSPMKVRAR